MNSKEKAFISLVIYLNTKNNLEKINEIASFFDERFANIQLILVAELGVSKKDLVNVSSLPKDTIFIDFKNFQGVDKSIRCGVDLSVGDFVIEIENLLVAPNDLWQLYQTATGKKPFDVVFLYNKSVKKISSFFYLLLKKIDTSLDTKSILAIILSRRMINQLSKVNDKIYYRKLLYKNFNFDNASITSSKKLKNDKKALFEQLELASNVLFFYTNVSSRISFFLSIGFMGLSLLLLSYTIAIFFLGISVVGWTTIMLFLSIAFSGVFFMFLIFTKYFELMMKNYQNFPDYNLKSITKLNGN